MVPRQHRSVAPVDAQSHGIVENPTMLSMSFTWSAFFRYAGVMLIVGVPILVLVLLILYPLAAIILQSIFPNIYAIHPNLAPSLSAIQQVFTNPLNYQALGNSLWLSAITSVIASILGTVLAVLAKRSDLRLRGLMDTLGWIVFFFPSCLIGEAWSVTMIARGIPGQFLHFSDGFSHWFFSPVDVIFILCLRSCPRA